MVEVATARPREDRLRPVGQHGIESYAEAEWFPDGKRILLNGHEAGRGTRLFVQDMGGSPRGRSPRRARARAVSSPTAALVLARMPDGGYGLYPLDGGEARPGPGLAPPPDRTGLLSLRGLTFTHDMRSYAYTAYYQVSSLFVSEPSGR